MGPDRDVGLMADAQVFQVLDLTLPVSIIQVPSWNSISMQKGVPECRERARYLPHNCPFSYNFTILSLSTLQKCKNGKAGLAFNSQGCSGILDLDLEWQGESREHFDGLEGAFTKPF